ncbi:hypothetical protein AKJ52_01715 [candidate division MSBL1 archaeon SCGC-AAA382C18]|uniref:PAC domain-containing protein n=1 Tax=candidate division MSBL1 archaeon SCGC-AAA382C18 TaxID=1698281 RepID=A0A133VJX5_9EURY|nr:hypothetical protein AKJ52_01715 [candidate division MSBL1 archaeon SCGC-AAA382C18]
MGKTAEDLWPEADEIMKDEEKALNGEAIIGREREVTFPNGETKWYSIYKLPRRDIDNNIVDFLGMDRDITNRKKMEKELRQSEREKTKIFNNMSEHIVYLDKDGKVLKA